MTRADGTTAAPIVDVARNLYEEAGQGLADDAMVTIWGSRFDGRTPISPTSDC